MSEVGGGPGCGKWWETRQAGKDAGAAQRDQLTSRVRLMASQPGFFKEATLQAEDWPAECGSRRY